jgi:hypothetical protein
VNVKPFDEMTADEMRAEAERRNAARAADPGAARGMPSRPLSADVALQRADVVLQRAANASRSFLGIDRTVVVVEHAPKAKGRVTSVAIAGTELHRSEHEEQVELFRWLDEMSLGRYPTFRKAYAIPNFPGHVGSERTRQRAGAIMLAEGRKAGMLDLCYPVARGPYHALYVEMKRERGGHLKDKQLDWMIELAEEGNRVVRCKGADEAKTAFLRYESLGKFGTAPKQEDRHMLR